MVSENPTWGAPRIHGGLLKLGFYLSERSVSRCDTTSDEPRFSRRLQSSSVLSHLLQLLSKFRNLIVNEFDL
jgi:hypothetical protein